MNPNIPGMQGRQTTRTTTTTAFSSVDSVDTSYQSDDDSNLDVYGSPLHDIAEAMFDPYHTPQHESDDGSDRESNDNGNTIVITRQAAFDNNLQAAERNQMLSGQSSDGGSHQFESIPRESELNTLPVPSAAISAKRIRKSSGWSSGGASHRFDSISIEAMPVTSLVPPSPPVVPAIKATAPKLPQAKEDVADSTKSSESDSESESESQLRNARGRGQDGLNVTQELSLQALSRAEAAAAATTITVTDTTTTQNNAQPSNSNPPLPPPPPPMQQSSTATVVTGNTLAKIALAAAVRKQKKSVSAADTDATPVATGPRTSKPAPGGAVSAMLNQTAMLQRARLFHSHSTAQVQDDDSFSTHSSEWSMSPHTS